MTLASPVQSCPQTPQFSGSVLRSTHLAPQMSGAGATQLALQVGVVAVVEQSAVGAVH